MRIIEKFHAALSKNRVLHQSCKRSKQWTTAIHTYEKLWNAAIDRVTVYVDERVVFHFKDGKDITELL